MSEQRILIVTDRPDFPRAALERRELAVTIAKDCEMAFDKLLGVPFDLLAIDFASSYDGIDFIKRVRATPQLTGILVLVLAEWGTGEPTLALATGADAYEPNETRLIDPERLITSIERLLSREGAAAKQQSL